ncbi:MAG: hexose kinase [Candidatus Methanomethyliaceae archaeon]
MILTLTPNSALDKVIFIEAWTPGKPMRTTQVVPCVGGKGLDASVTLACLGVETVALAFLAGENGRQLLRLAEQYGIRCEAVWADGETRLAHVIVERRYHRHSHIITGELQIRPEQMARFLECFRHWVRNAQWVICGGSIPPSALQDLYAHILREAEQVGVPVLLDAAGQAVLAAAPHRPTLLKMNRDEFASTFGIQAATLEAWKAAAQQVYRDLHLNALVLTAGRDGLLALTPEGGYRVLVPKQKVVNAAGAGDAASAALAWRLSQGEAWSTALQWAGAVSSASVLTEATAECRMDDVRRLLPQVRVTRWA